MRWILALLLALSVNSFAQKEQPKTQEEQKTIDLLLQELLGELSAEIKAQNHPEAVAARLAAKNAIAGAVIEKLIYAPIMVAICEERLSKKDKAVTNRMDATKMEKVAAYDGKIYALIHVLAAASFPTLKNKELSNTVEQLYWTVSQEILSDCINDIEAETWLPSQRSGENDTIPFAKLPERVKNEIVARAKTIEKQWDEEHKGKALEVYQDLEEKYYLETIEEIQNGRKPKNSNLLRANSVLKKLSQNNG